MHRKISCFAIILFLLQFLAGCSTPSLDADEIIAKTENHIVYRADGVCYMEFFEEITEGYTVITSSDYRIEYETLDDLKNAILKNSFTPYQQWTLEFADSDNVIEIVDVEHLWMPVSPKDVSLESIKWFTYKCDFELISESYGADIEATLFSNGVSLSPKESEDNQSLYTRQDGIINSIVNKEKTRQYIMRLDSKNAEVLSFYTVNDENFSIEIYEFYRYAINESDDSIIETGIPNAVTITITGENLVSQIFLSSFTSRPTEEWLLSFGMEPYVPEDNATE